MADWKRGAELGAAGVVLAALAALVGFTVYQGFAESLESRFIVAGGAAALLALLALSWKRLALWTRPHLVATYLVALVGALALLYTPEAKDVFRIGPLSLAALVNLLVLLSLTVSLFFILRGLSLSARMRAAIGVLGGLCAVPFAIGLWRDLSLAELFAGFGWLGFLPWYVQPAVLGVALLPPLLLVYLLIELVRAARDPERSTLRGALNIVCAAAPLAVGIASLLGTPYAGVVARTFAGHHYGSIAAQGLERDVTLAWEEPLADEGGKFWVEWEGQLRVPEAGAYRFRFTGNAAGHLFLDGRRALHEKGSSDEITLEAGVVRLRAAAISDTAAGQFAVEWRGPGDEDFQPIDASHLSHTPDQESWRRTPRQAAQVGIDWLQSASVEWQNQRRCFGCHVQGQVLMGLAVARANDYRVNESAYAELATFTREIQNDDGTYHSGHHITATQFAAMGLAYFDAREGVDDDASLAKSLTWLLERQQAGGEVPIDHSEAPIDQGSIMTTANSAIAFREAERQTGEERYARAAERALGWLQQAEESTTQDRIMKILAFTRAGGPEERAATQGVVDALLADQQPDGGWRETPRMDGSNAYATGQVLYALKQAGQSVNSTAFRNGVRFLLERQRVSGAWPPEHTQTHRPSEFAPTMWAVIGLAGSFGEIIPEILEPKLGSSVAGSTRIDIAVTNFTDADIESVAVEVNGIALGRADPSDEDGRYSLPWNAAAASDGAHRIRVVASNADGKRGETEGVVHTGMGIRVRIAAPEPGARVGGPVELAARAEVSEGQEVASVLFSVDGTRVGEAVAPGPDGLYRVPWDAVEEAEGRHRIVALATSSIGQEARDEVEVLRPAPLQVRIVAPPPNARVMGNVPCSVEVQRDPGADVTSVDFGLDGDAFASAAAPRLEARCDFSGRAAGAHELSVEVADSRGNRARDAIAVRIGEDRGPGYLKVQLENRDAAGSEQVLYFPPQHIELVLDLSNSMWGQIAGRAKVEIMREVLGGLLRGFPADSRLGVRVYGHRKKNDCGDTELLVPLGPLDAESVIGAVNGLKPRGKTPIDRSLRLTQQDLTGLEGSKVVILLTDGVESCDGDPVAAAQHLVEQGLAVKIHVVGFDVGDAPEAVAQLRRVAEAGDGSFFQAQNAEQLQDALADAVRLTYTVYDQQGQTVFREPLSLESHELMSGSYRLAVGLDPPLVLDGVEVAKGEMTVVRVIKEGDRFRLVEGDGAPPASLAP